MTESAMGDDDSKTKPAAMAIVVGGRPAPGINGVIGAATIEAVNNGLNVLGMYDVYAFCYPNRLLADLC